MENAGGEGGGKGAITSSKIITIDSSIQLVLELNILMIMVKHGTTAKGFQVVDMEF